MGLREVGRIPLPSHTGDGGFDHAAVDGRRDRLYVAHTANDCVEVIDLAARRAVGSIPNVRGVAGIWVDQATDRWFSSNRGEDTVSVFELDTDDELIRLPTGARPNGIAFDPGRKRLFVAGVGNAETGAPPTVTIFDLDPIRRVGQLVAPGRTRWATYHAGSDRVFVNVAAPPQILDLSAQDPLAASRSIPIRAEGPHGLEQDAPGARLLCASDDGSLLEVDLTSRATRRKTALSGPPDVVWRNGAGDLLYVAVGDPGVVDVIALDTFERVESVRTERGAHTLTVDPAREEVHVFLPRAHADLVLGRSD